MAGKGDEPQGSGRHRERESGSGRRSSRRDETEEERLLRKAKRFVEDQERDRKDKNRRESRGRDDGDRKHRRRDEDGGRDRGRHRSSRKKEGGEHDRRPRNDSDSDRSRSRKRHKRSREDKHDRSRKKKDKKERHEEKKLSSKKHSGKSDIGKGHSRMSKQQKIDVGKLFPLGAITSTPPSEKLDADANYFEMHQELRLWLFRSDGTYFEDLSSSDARKAFSSFVRRYNDGQLEEAYYDPKGLPPEALAQCKRTQHRWAFRTNVTEERSLEMVREGVRKQTEYDVKTAGKATGSGGRHAAVISDGVRHQPAGYADGDRRRRKTAEDISAEKAAHRRLRESVRVAEEEMTPGGRKGGRERQIEKRREKANAMHGPARDREDELMGGPEMDDEALYGGRSGGRGSFEDALAKEKMRKSKKEEQKAVRIAELQKKEEDKQKAMLQMLGLTGIKPGQKITIAPRKG